MQEILVISDSHGLTNRVQKIKDRHNISTMIHCGDSELPNDHPFIEDLTIVQGNCDRPGEFNEEEQLTIDGLNIYVTHGHLYQVKSDLLSLTYRAEEVGAHIVCFGHSHIAGAEKIDGRLYINPGSIRYPRRIKERTYVILSWENPSVIKVQFLDLDGNELGELSRTFHLN